MIRLGNGKEVNEWHRYDPEFDCRTLRMWVSHAAGESSVRFPLVAGRSLRESREMGKRLLEKAVEQGKHGEILL